MFIFVIHLKHWSIVTVYVLNCSMCCSSFKSFSIRERSISKPNNFWGDETRETLRYSLLCLFPQSGDKCIKHHSNMIGWWIRFSGNDGWCSSQTDHLVCYSTLKKRKERKSNFSKGLHAPYWVFYILNLFLFSKNVWSRAHLFVYFPAHMELAYCYLL